MEIPPTVAMLLSTATRHVLNMFKLCVPFTDFKIQHGKTLFLVLPMVCHLLYMGKLKTDLKQHFILLLNK